MSRAPIPTRVNGTTFKNFTEAWKANAFHASEHDKKFIKLRLQMKKEGSITLQSASGGTYTFERI